MIYFAYKETGEFDGFYDDEIHSEIPITSVKITQDLQNNLLTGSWFINIEKLNDIKGILDIQDKNTFFTEHEIESLPFVDPQTTLLKQLAQNKIDNMKKDAIINNLIKQTAANKLEIMKMKGSNVNE